MSRESSLEKAKDVTCPTDNKGTRESILRKG